jgi:hypothetical protein
MRNIYNFLFEISVGTVDQRWSRAKQISDYVGMITRFIIVMGFTKFAEKHLSQDAGGYSYTAIVVICALYALSTALALSVMTVPYGIIVSALPKPKPGWIALAMLPFGLAMAALAAFVMMGVAGVLLVGFLHDYRP